jgi:hypothetical protein
MVFLSKLKAFIMRRHILSSMPLRSNILLLIVIFGGLSMGFTKEEAVSPYSFMRLNNKDVPVLEKKADAGDIEAIKCLRVHFTRIDFAKQVKYARMGSKLTDAESQYSLFMFLRNSKIAKERKEGLLALKSAAEHNYILAQVTLADCYRIGESVKKNILLAEKWYRKASLLGYYHAMRALVNVIKSRANNIQALREAYGWTVIIVDRTTSKVAPSYVDLILELRKEILIKATALGTDKNEFVKDAEIWAETIGRKIPRLNPMAIQGKRCKYMNMDADTR